MDILIACEESQTECIEFLKLGHNVYPCDLQVSSGGRPDRHINNDVLHLLNGFCSFITENGDKYYLNKKWDLIIAHPPCTYLTVSGNRWFDIDKYGISALDRLANRYLAAEFFMRFVNADCFKICIENPVGFMSSYYRKPDQIRNPFLFGDPEPKKTCLWLKNLFQLQCTKFVEPEYIIDSSGKRYGKTMYFNGFLPADERRRIRSKSFTGIAAAMAEQWG